MNDRRENPLEGIEAAALSLILQRLMVRGRLALELDLKDLEHEVGRELPEVRTHLDSMLGLHTSGLSGSAPMPMPPAARLNGSSHQALPYTNGDAPKRRGRQPKDANRHNHDDDDNR